MYPALPTPGGELSREVNSTNVEMNSSWTTRSNNISAADDQWQLMIIQHNLRPLTPAGYLTCALYLLFVGVIATAGNSTTLLMFSRNKKLRNKPHNMLLINLALSDLGISIFGFPLTMASCFAQRWLFGYLGCQVQSFATFVFALTHMYTLTVVSLYRWVAVCVPHHHHRLTYRLTLKVIVAIWTSCCIICGLPLVGMSRFTYEPYGTSCTIDWDDDKLPSVIYVYGLIVVAYLGPVGIMSYCYTKVVRRSRQLLQALKAAKEKTLNLGQAEDTNCALAENKVTWISLLLVAVFVIIWSPYAFVSVWAIYDANIPVWLSTLPTMSCKASCMLNPIIFYLTNPVFKNTFRATFMRSNRVGIKEGPFGQETFKVDRTKDGIFIGESKVTFKKAETTMF